MPSSISCWYSEKNLARRDRAVELAKRLGVEMGMHPGRRIPPHIGEQLDALAQQQIAEFGQRSGRVTDGPDDGGAHPCWTPASGVGSVGRGDLLADA